MNVDVVEKFKSLYGTEIKMKTYRIFKVNSDGVLKDCMGYSDNYGACERFLWRWLERDEKILMLF